VVERRIGGTTRVVGVLGWPIEHTLSPTIHNAAFRSLGLDWAYVPLPVRPGDLDAALAGVRAAVPSLRWTAPEQWHLTLAFLGPLARLAPVVDGLRTLSGRGAFTMRLGGGGAFPSVRRARVLWLGTLEGGEAVSSLAGAVASTLAPLGYEPEGRRFHPHLTLARLRVPGDVAAAVSALGDSPVGEAFRVSEVVLYESRLSPRGSTYTALERVRLD
jgi:2'-5' RNA ligase